MGLSSPPWDPPKKGFLGPPGTPPKTRVFGGFLGRKSPHLNTPLRGVLWPVGGLSTRKKVKKGPRGAVFSLFSKISPPLCQK